MNKDRITYITRESLAGGAIFLLLGLGIAAIAPEKTAQIVAGMTFLGVFGGAVIGGIHTHKNV